MITGSRKPQKIWKELIRNQELKEFCTYVKFSGYKQTPVPCMNATGLTKLLKVCKGGSLGAFCKTAAKELLCRMGDNEQYLDSDWEDDHSEEEISKSSINADHEPKSSKMQMRWIPSLSDQLVDKYYRDQFGEKHDLVYAAMRTSKESNQEGERLEDDGNGKLKTNQRDYVLFGDMNCLMKQKLKDVPAQPKLKKVVVLFGGVPDKNC
ncbi:hypothetical protein BDK51DRAFT_28950 [Blyttiomyces helicus]|uniref:Uncharacterized protein n=1 Tax=Blyttiomyces helicus TaxID=388810 RepID=A0A4P9WPF3_9FUNG|nr:hypothetical protein BDK51DRAFT_28950 [Blyttiomyces helicus]|eukprot:RKO94382.1 hypothetical protein BDK51DRAFT_28950 [Blyttiomyces helicus]